MKKAICIFLCLLLAVSVFAACGKVSPEGKAQTPTVSDPEKPNVVATIFPIYDFCRVVAGDKVNLSLLLDSKTDLHSYSPTTDDILRISNADLFFFVGGESDDWVEGVLASAENEALQAIALMETVDAAEEEALPGMQEEEEEPETDGPELDEHIWTSLKNAQDMVNAIAEAFASVDADNAQVYRANAAAYNKQLAALETQYAETIAGAKRKVLLFADRFPFRYLQRDYDLECYAAFSGCSAETEASFDTLAMLVQTTKDKALPYILMIEGSDSAVAQSVSAQTGAEIRVLNSCQSVSADDIKNGVTYLSVMESNLDVLKEVLN